MRNGNSASPKSNSSRSKPQRWNGQLNVFLPWPDEPLPPIPAFDPNYKPKPYEHDPAKLARMEQIAFDEARGAILKPLPFPIGYEMPPAEQYSQECEKVGSESGE